MSVTAPARSLSGLEAVALTAAASFAEGVFVMPRILVADAGRAGGLVLLAVALLTAAWATVIAWRAWRVEDRALAAATVRRLGLFGRVWLVVCGAFAVLLAGTMVREYAGMAATVIMPGASRLSVIVLIAVAAASAARHRVEGLARTILIAFVAAALLTAVTFVLVLARAPELFSALPGPHLAVRGLAAGLFDASALFAGTSVLVLLLPFQESAHRGLPHVLRGVLLGMAMMILAYVATVGTLGPQYVLSQVWPVVTAMRTLVLSSFVINRFGTVVAMAWSAFVLAFTAIQVWAAGEFWSLAVGARDLRWLFVVLSLAGLVALGVALPDQATTEEFVRGVVDPATIGVFVLWLGVALLATRRPARVP